jgi:glutathione S-transferase
MKLYGSLASPFVARCWLAITAKGGGVELAMYEGGIKSPGYLAMNPMGKMPLLVDGDVALPESAVICEYLDAKLPGPALMPADPAGHAMVRLLCRIADIYVFPPSVTLLRAPKDGDAGVVAEAAKNVSAAFDHLEHFLSDTGYAHGNSITLADCTLQTAVSLALLVMGKHGIDSKIGERPKLGRWWQACNANPILKPAIEKIHEEALAFRKRREEEAARQATAG